MINKSFNMYASNNPQYYGFDHAYEVKPTTKTKKYKVIAIIACGACVVLGIAIALGLFLSNNTDASNSKNEDTLSTLTPTVSTKPTRQPTTTPSEAPTVSPTIAYGPLAGFTYETKSTGYWANYQGFAGITCENNDCSKDANWRLKVVKTWTYKIMVDRTEANGATANHKYMWRNKYGADCPFQHAIQTFRAYSVNSKVNNYIVCAPVDTGGKYFLSYSDKLDVENLNCPDNYLITGIRMLVNGNPQVRCRRVERWITPPTVNRWFHNTLVRPGEYTVQNAWRLRHEGFSGLRCTGGCASLEVRVLQNGGARPLWTNDLEYTQIMKLEIASQAVKCPENWFVTGVRHPGSNAFFEFSCGRLRNDCEWENPSKVSHFSASCPRDQIVVGFKNFGGNTGIQLYCSKIRCYRQQVNTNHPTPQPTSARTIGIPKTDWNGIDDGGSWTLRWEGVTGMDCDKDGSQDPCNVLDVKWAINTAGNPYFDSHIKYYRNSARNTRRMIARADDKDGGSNDTGQKLCNSNEFVNEVYFLDGDKSGDLLGINCAPFNGNYIQNTGSHRWIKGYDIATDNACPVDYLVTGFKGWTGEFFEYRCTKILNWFY